MGASRQTSPSFSSYLLDLTIAATRYVMTNTHPTSGSINTGPWLSFTLILLKFFMSSRHGDPLITTRLNNAPQILCHRKISHLVKDKIIAKRYDSVTWTLMLTKSSASKISGWNLPLGSYFICFSNSTIKWSIKLSRYHTEEGNIYPQIRELW